MKTDDLIRLLAADHAAPRPHIPSRLALGAMAGAAVAIGVLAVSHGFRPDLAADITNWRLLLKFAVGLMLAATGAILALRLARPVEAAGRVWLLLIPAPLVLVAASAYELWAMPPDQWMPRAMGLHPLACLVSVPLISSLPLAGVLWALREGAPAIPAQAGAAAGAMAAGIGAAVYALHCPDDSPLFLAVWYLLAAAAVVIAGWATGARLLRW
jgi:hypothetical protein